MYFNDADAAIIVYDVTFRESFDKANDWAKDLAENCSNQDVLVCVVANKCDLTEE